MNTGQNDDSRSDGSRPDRWQAQLETHFAELATKRSGSKLAVFGLEHGLLESDVKSIEQLVREEVRSLPRKRHWLLWIAYASEIGYAFSGGEYWQTFAKQTPGWDDSNSSREWIRSIFRDFRDVYGGPEPTGDWARVFSIIAWPITNAILPKDLQRHVARALHEAGSTLIDHLSDHENLGRFIGESYWHGTDRFAQLAEQPRLLGQIAMALLRPDEVGDETLLSRTLHRVADDLQKERQSASWLHGARRSIAPRFRARGGSTTRGQEAESDNRIIRATRSARMKLFLTSSSEGDEDLWAASLSPPYLGPLLDTSPEIRAQLASSRAEVPASPSRRIATGALLYPAQPFPLERWPLAGQPLIKLNGMSQGLEAALLAEWSMPREPWIFALRGDGIAEMMQTQILRPGQSYIYVARDSEFESPAGLDLARLNSPYSDVQLWRLDIPSYLTEDLVESLRLSGIDLIRSIKIWPAGSIPSIWDGEGRVEWLTTDHPYFGIQADHELKSIRLKLNGTDFGSHETFHQSLGFIALPRLSTGTHELKVEAKDPQGRTVTATLTIDLRDPRPSRSAQAGALIAWVEPYTSRLEEIWDGSSAIRAAGFEATTCACTFELARRPGANPLARRQVAIDLPLSSDGWRRVLRSSIQDDDFQDAYPESAWARVVIESSRFGRNELEFERELPPIRWTLKKEGDESFLVLRDDTERGEITDTAFASFRQPDKWQTIRLHSQQQLKVESTGGLYRARTNVGQALMIVPPAKGSLRSFADLGLKPELSRRPRKQPWTLSDLLGSMDLWASARLPGNLLAHVWRVNILQAMQRDLFSLLCGPGWRRAEAHLHKTQSEAAFDALSKLVVRSKADRLSVAGALINNRERFLNQTLEERIDDFHSLTRRFPERAGPRWQELVRNRGDDATRWMSEFCLRASSDVRLASWAEPFTEQALAATLEWPLTVRTARCLALASLIESDHDDFPPLLPHWEWSRI